DRYLAAFLSEQVGAEFEGRVSGIAKFGLFVKLLETGADGIIPLSQLGREYWRYIERDGTLKGEDSGRVIAVGMPCKVSLVDATALTGGLTLEMLELNGKPMPKSSSGRGQHRGRKFGKSKGKKRKLQKRR
ncbi:MAG: S1 RNA-binding domain-containing protein, partial [Amylibacter sp.]|nr:S1 RNA-binding domain-containing protein [Amylibacter sp.]